MNKKHKVFISCDTAGGSGGDSHCETIVTVKSEGGSLKDVSDFANMLKSLGSKRKIVIYNGARLCGKTAFVNNLKNI